jgi:hypothetical protein
VSDEYEERANSFTGTIEEVVVNVEPMSMGQANREHPVYDGVPRWPHHPLTLSSLSDMSAFGRCCRKIPCRNWALRLGSVFGLFLAERGSLIGEYRARVAMPLTQSSQMLLLLLGRVDAAPSS